MTASIVQQASTVLPTLPFPVQTAPGITYRALEPNDYPDLKAAHAALFPIDYEDNFFVRATSGLDRMWSCAAVSRDLNEGEKLVGFIVAKTVFLHEVDASDRQHMGLLSAVLDHDRVLYIMTLGVVEGQRHKGIASTLISIACQHAYEARCRVVFLHVITYNTAAMSLYSRQGFSCVAKLRGFYFIATGRAPDPQQQVYDAYLFVQYVGPIGGVPSPWDLVSLAWSPLRFAFNRIHSCMPGFCRSEQHAEQALLLNRHDSDCEVDKQCSSTPCSPPPPHVPNSTSAHPHNVYEAHRKHRTRRPHLDSHHQQCLQQPAQQQWHLPPQQNRKLPRRWRSLAVGHFSNRHHAQQQQPQQQQPAQADMKQVPAPCERQEHMWLQAADAGGLSLQYHSQVEQPQQQQQQSYELHRSLQPRQQRVLRWLFNGASRNAADSAGLPRQQPDEPALLVVPAIETPHRSV